VDDAAGLLETGPHMPLDDVDTGDDDLFFSGDDLADGARLPSVPALDDQHCVFAADLLGHGYTTSRARETIFMKFFSRSSRATGPKMRLPLGLRRSARMTAALSSKRM